MKRLIRDLDNKFLFGFITKAYSKLVGTFKKNFESQVQFQHFPQSYNGAFSFYRKNYECELSRLCDYYGSDKGEVQSTGHPYPWPSHTYADYYSSLFSHCRLAPTKVFECGLGTNNPDIVSSMGVNGKPGASLRVWRDYFPNAKIYGADIDKEVLFEEDRIKTFYVDQLDPESIHDLWVEVGVNDFDFMLDDGLHTFEAGSTLFLNSISRLAQHGVYVIEDVNGPDLREYEMFFSQLNYRVEFISLHRPGMDLNDNSLVVIRKNGL
jgi:hypothetical protein